MYHNWITVFFFIVKLLCTGQMDKAESIAQEALTILPQEPALHFNLANTLGKAGRFAEAEKHFIEAIGLDMKNALYYTNLGESQTHDDT
jgi:Flp pilus assembly protein TadD